MVTLRRPATVAALALPELAVGVAWTLGTPRFLVAAAQLLVLLGYGLAAGFLSWRSASRSHLEQVHAAAVLAERSRLAAEMHDVLGHRLALLALTAGALQLQTDGAARRTAAELRAGVDGAVAELAAAIAVLGEHPAEPAPTGLSTLLAQARTAGMSISVGGDLPADLAGPVQQVALGVVREGLTNAARHAAGAPVHLQVGTRADTLEVRLTNPTEGVTARPGARTGLATLQRRAEALGGRLEHRSGAGGFALTLTLPLTSPVVPVPRAPRVPSATTLFVRRAWAPTLACLVAVLAFYTWASAGTTLEPAQFAALEAGRPAGSLPPREAPVRLLPAPPPPADRDCHQYTDGSFPLAYATFQVCVTDQTVTSTTDLRRATPW